MNTEVVSFAGKRVYIGLDVHRSFFVASCMCEGAVVKRCRMAARSEAVISFVSKFFPESEVYTCYEAGYSGFWLHHDLTLAGVKNIVVHPAAIEVAANNRVKTDKRDSLKMAQQLEAGRLKGIRVPTIDQEHKRLLVRTREQLVRARCRVQVQIRMRLHQFGKFPTHIQRVIRPKDVEELLESLDENLRIAIECLYKQWKHLIQQIKEVDARIREQAKADPLDELYRSVPGVGPLIARTLSNELGDMSQFPNVRALYSFTGLTPGEFSSGDKIARGRISKQGSSRLRHLLVEAAWVAIRKDPTMKEFYQSLASRVGKKRAIVACARKLAGKTRAVVRTKNKYEIRQKT